jgi:hypothetical protein
MQSSCGFSHVTGIDVAANRAKWRASGITDYRMRVSIQKTGHGTPMGTYVIRVRDGQVVSIHMNGPSTPRSSDAAPEPEKIITDDMFLRRFGPYDTIEDYFHIIETAGAMPHILETEFDPVMGYPKLLHLDPSSEAIDDELMVRVLELEKIE